MMKFIMKIMRVIIIGMCRQINLEYADQMQNLKGARTKITIGLGSWVDLAPQLRNIGLYGIFCLRRGKPNWHSREIPRKSIHVIILDFIRTSSCTFIAYRVSLNIASYICFIMRKRNTCRLYTSPGPGDVATSRMPSSA